MNKSSNAGNVIWLNLVVLLSMDIIFDMTYFISGIYTNFHTFLRKVWQDICQKPWCNEIDDYRLLFSFNFITTQNS